MANAKVLLESRCQDFEKAKQMVYDMIDISTSAEAPEELENQLAIVQKVRDKAMKGKEEYQNACANMEQQGEQARQHAVAMYQSVPHQGEDQLSCIDDVAKVLKCKKKALKDANKKIRKVQQQHKEQEYVQKLIRLQQRSLPVQFDLSSTTEDTRGYFKKEDNTIQTFSFDLTKESPTSVADYLWNTAS